jgi:hypothetical protein
MANAFDQFDETTTNAFDQFDESTPAPAPAAVVPPESGRVPTADPSILEGAAHVAGGVAEIPFDVMDLPNLIASGTGWGLEKLGYPEAAETYEGLFPKASELPYVKDLKGLLTDPFVEKGTNPALDAGRTFASWASPGIVAKAKGLTAVPDVLAGLGAAGAEYLSDGNPLGETAGGIAGLLAGALRGKTPGDKAVNQASDFITDITSESPDAQAKLVKAIEGGDKGTLADFTESPGAYNLEHTMGQKGSGLRQQIEDATLEAENVMQGQVSGVIPNAPLASSKIAAERNIADAQAGLETDRVATLQQVQQADEAATAAALAKEARMSAEIGDSQAISASLRGEADAAQGTLANQLTPPEASKQLHADYAVLDAEKKVIEKAAWRKLDDSPAIDVSDAVKDLPVFLNDMKLAKTHAKAVRSAFSAELDAIESWGKNAVEPKEIQAVLSNMKQKIHDAGVTGKTPFEHTVGQNIVKYVETMLVETPTTKGFKEAISATVDRNKTARPDSMGKLRNSPDIETFSDRVNFTGSKGAGTARLVEQSGNPAVVESAHNTVRAAGKAAENGVDEAFMAKHKGYLDAFPDLQKELQDIAAAKTDVASDAVAAGTREGGLSAAIEASAKAREAAPTALNKALGQVNTGTAKMKAAANKGPIADFAADADGRAYALLDGKTSEAGTKELTDLHDWAKTNSVDASFKARIKGQLLDKLFPETKSLTRATGKSASEFNKVKQRLMDSGILSEKEVAGIEKALKTTTDRQTARKAAGFVEVAPKVTGGEKLAATAGALVTVASTGMPHALLATRFTRDLIESEIKRRKLSPAAQTKIAEFIVNPEQYADAYKRLNAARAKGGRLDAEKMQDILRAVVATGNAGTE